MTERSVRSVDICDYNQALYLAHRRSGLQYQTGPRYGQQLAELRFAELELSTRPAVQS